MTDPVLLVPRRSDGGHRDRLWSHCRSWWKRHDFRIVEGHHDDGPFNRSAAVNRAAEAAGDWSTAFIVDSDVIAHPSRVREAARIAQDGPIAYPHTYYVPLGKDSTERILGGYSGSWEPFVSFSLNVSDGFALSCVVIGRTLWDEVGGMDERFEGWGGEDHAFWRACTLAGGDHVALDGPLWHLWHPSPADKLISPEYQRNADRLAAYWRAESIEDIRGI